MAKSGCNAGERRQALRARGHAWDLYPAMARDYPPGSVGLRVKQGLAYDAYDTYETSPTLGVVAA